MGLRPGYKQTEVGVIPEDWDVVMLGDFSVIGTGGTPSREVTEYWNGSIPWLTTTQIDFNRIVSANEFITKGGLKNSAAKVYPAGTLLMAMYGQGKTRGKVAITGIDAAINQACAAILVTDSVSKSFVFYYLSSRYQEIRNLSNSGSQENLNSYLIKTLPITIPPTKAEQEAIAEALRDADALIESLEQLIAKKRDLKRGAMHELLTGEKRLPGFGAEWKPGLMSDYFEPVTTRNEELNNNVVTISAQQGFVRQEEFFKKRVASNVLSNYYLLERGQFAYNRSYSNGYPFGAVKLLNKFDKAVVTTLYICFRPKPGAAVCLPFFEQYFEAGLLNDGLASVANEGGRAHGLLNVTKADFFSRPVKVPDFDEQTAIAAILSDMDEEIAALDAKLDKARRVKQGMMHNLLTGSIRLMES